MIYRLIATAIAAIFLLSPGAHAAADPLTDPQIAHTAGVIDIDAAKQAMKISKNQDVVCFARNMVRDHEAVNKQESNLLKRLNMKPEDNDTSRSLKKAAADEHRKLAEFKGAEFDKAYIENEISYYKLVNSTLESTLIPSAKNEELKALFQSGLKIFQGHEQHAEQVSRKLK